MQCNLPKILLIEYVGDRRQRIDKVSELIGTCPSHKDLDASMYFHCLCQFGIIVPSPLIGASLTLINLHLMHQINLNNISTILNSNYQNLLVVTQQL